LHSALLGEFEPNGSISYVLPFLRIAIFILVIACINFMNLSNCPIRNRAREVGVRKVMGSQRGQLISQFLSESMLLTLLSFILAVMIRLFFSAGIQYAGGSATDPSVVGPGSTFCCWASLVVALLGRLIPAFFCLALNRWPC